MAANIGLDARIAAMKAVTGAGLTWAQRVYDLLNAALNETTNPFGSVATTATGTAAGQIPLLGPGGRFPAGLEPGRAAARVTGTLVVPNDTATLAARPQVDQMPSIPITKITTGVIDFRIIPPFDASRISGRILQARLPPAGGTPNITTVNVNTTVNTTRQSTNRFATGRAQITNRAVSITRAGTTVTAQITMTAVLRQEGQDPQN